MEQIHRGVSQKDKKPKESRKDKFFNSGGPEGILDHWGGVWLTL